MNKEVREQLSDSCESSEAAVNRASKGSRKLRSNSSESFHKIAQFATLGAALALSSEDSLAAYGFGTVPYPRPC